MTTPQLLLASTLTLVLSACGGGAPVRPAPVTQACNAADAQFAVGQVATATLVEEARRHAGAQVVRVLRPGQVVTLEFSEQRLNLDVDAAGRVLKARCG